MWSSRLFLKLFFAYAALILLTTGACSAIFAGWQESQLVEQVKRRLRDSATLLRDRVEGEILAGGSEQLQTHVRSLGEQTETRFTLVAASGKVLADSEQESLADVATMDNHLARKEFVQAKLGGTGYSRRVSPTLQTPFIYFALAIPGNEEPRGYVRAAEPIAPILEEAAAVRRVTGLVGLTVGVAGLVLSYWLTRRFLQPIQTLTDAVEEMTAGNTPRRFGITSDDEVGTLAHAFERMVDRLSRRENALRESADRQSTVLSGMNEGVLAVDDQQRVLFANLAASNMLGFSAEQVEEHSLLEVVRSNDLREIVQRALATEMLTQSEIEWQSDTLRTLEVNATPLPGDPCPGVVLVLHDISELKRLEGLRQQFVANVSHELKTPLSSIKAYTETLINGALEDPEHARRFLKRIDDQSDRLHELIIDLLALARIESGQATIERTSVPLGRIVTSCLADCETRAESSQIELVNEPETDEIDVFADEESLRQILSNLIDNALKYTPEGGTVTVRSRKDSGNAVIDVIDTGPGIEAKHHERLFERFYRVDKARSRELGGTGLGLAIVKHLCNAMDGTVTVDSVPGQGSTFCVTIPVAHGQSVDS